jgi:signal peptidase I
VFVIRGASMTPAIPLGALALVDTRARTPAAGDVVTVRSPNGVHVTHRVVRVVADPSGSLMELRGDANGRSDAALVPVSATVGTVRGHVPVAGFLVALLSAPTGLIAILAAAGCLLLAKWVLEESEETAGSPLVARETMGEAAA